MRARDWPDFVINPRQQVQPEERSLVQLDCNDYGFGAPAWSPDGRFISAINWYIILPSRFIEMDLVTFEADSGDIATTVAEGCSQWIWHGRPTGHTLL